MTVSNQFSRWIALCMGIAASLIMFSANVAKAQDIKPSQTFVDCPDCPIMTLMADDTAMGIYPVTRGQFAQFAEATGTEPNAGCFIRIESRWKKDPESGWGNPGFEQEDDHPVVCVNWLEATAYADWISEITGKFYRLPSFEESVVATAAGAETTFWWGDDFANVCSHTNVADINYRVNFPDDPRDMADCNDGYAFTSPVGTFAPNAWGLYDVAGNVWQWTNSCLKGDCSNALFRGAGWSVPNPRFFKTSESWADRIVLRNAAVGFRIMRDPN